jgi:serine/threonine protein phosphatase PrpC
MSRPRSSLRYEVAGMTDQGKVRERNEDSFAVRRDLGLFLVADGMGGAPGGALASSLAVRSVVQSFKRSHRRSPPASRSAQAERARLVRAFRRANDHVFATACLYPQHKGMATTLAGLVVAGNHAVVAHVGDSRVYRVRGKSQIRTRDHSIGEDEKWRRENANAPELHDPDMQAKLVEVVGRDRSIRVTTCILPIQRGDAFVLCTDGLTNMLYDEDIIGLAIRDYRRAPMPPGRVLTTVSEQQAGALLHFALRRGGHDNVTIVIVRFP